MPRKPDPNLERTIVAAAQRLLDARGLEAVTMREVAKAAGTTTPTIYERFKDRDALLASLTDQYRNQLIKRLDPDDSLEQLGTKFVRFCCENPNAIDLLLDRVADNLKSKAKGPVYELVRTNLMRLNGFSAKDAEELTLATSATMAGAALLINRIGAQGQAAKELERATLRLLRTITGSGPRARQT